MTYGAEQRALLQGLIAGMILREERNGTFPLVLSRVDPVSAPRDEEGNYVDHIMVTTFSGVKLRVTVEVEEED